ncbi:MAG: hypothetical protein JWM59_2817 [Verrucomicrobiales bacterium]|nr:hypothetical protein [Verrucomicrobiales bacterium]
MTIVAKVIPLDAIGLWEGDTLIGLQLAGGNLVLQVAVAVGSAAPSEKTKTRLGGWGRKWAGSLVLTPGETRESLRAEAMKEKFANG